jgi:hypothetical protein
MGNLDSGSNLDIAAAGEDVSVLLGDGTGNFSAPNSFTVDGSQSIAIGYLDGDSNSDIVTVRTHNCTIISGSTFTCETSGTALLGDGTGSFAPAPDITLPNTPPGTSASTNHSVSVGDLDDDGDMDIVFGIAFAQEVRVFLNDGAGSFSPALNSPFSVAGTPSDINIAIGNMNGDSNLDLVVSTFDSNAGSAFISVLLGDGSGNFSTSAARNVGASGITSIDIGDLNGDTNLDVAASRYFNSLATILFGDGSGDFSSEGSISGNDGSYSVAIGDLTGDGSPDLALALLEFNSILVGVNDGAGGFVAIPGRRYPVDSTPSANQGPGFVTIGDLNGDGLPDVVTGNILSDTASVFLNTSPF